MVSRTYCLPSSLYSLPPPVKLRVYRVFPHREVALHTALTSAGPATSPSEVSGFQRQQCSSYTCCPEHCRPCQGCALLCCSSDQLGITPQRKEGKNNSSVCCTTASKMCILREMNVYLPIYVNQLAINIPRAQRRLTQITKDMPQIIED